MAATMYTVDCTAQGLRSIPEIPPETTHLILARNQLAFIQHTAAGFSPLAKLTKLRHLDMSESGLTSLANAFPGLLPVLETLLLQRNNLESLSDIILGFMPSLRTLNLGFNLLIGIPPNFAAGSALESLSLRENRITKLGAGQLDRAARLRAVDLARNPIGEVDPLAFQGDFLLQTIDLASDNSSLTAKNGSFAGLALLGAVNWLSSGCLAGFGSGFESSGLDMCLRCPSGTHKPAGPGSLLDCWLCDVGTTDHDRDPVTECRACNPGEFSKPGNIGICPKCPAGTIDHDGNPATPCTECKPGSYAAPGSIGLDACVACEDGHTDIDALPSTKCEPCAVGTSSPQNRIGPCAGNEKARKASTNAAIGAGIALGVLIVIAIIIIVVSNRRANKRIHEARRTAQEFHQRVRQQLNDSIQRRAGEQHAIAAKILRLETSRNNLHPCTPPVIIGQGEFGIVSKGLLASDDHSRPLVDIAIKRLHRTGLDDRAQERFLFEVQLTAAMEHPNIVRVLAVCTHSLPFAAALEFIDGGDLGHYLRHAEPKPGAADLTRVCNWVASALVYLKERGVIHRDLAARNVL